MNHNTRLSLNKFATVHDATSVKHIDKVHAAVTSNAAAAIATAKLAAIYHNDGGAL